MVAFTQLIGDLSSDGEVFHANVTDDWLQGRTTYGGLSASLCVEAARRSFGQFAPLRSAQFLFIGPVAGRVRMWPKLIRRGKSSVIVAVELQGEAGLAAQASLVFAVSRPSKYRYAGLSIPEVAAPADCPDFFGGTWAPDFAPHHFEARRAGGSALISAASDPDFLVWARHRDSDADGSMAALVALADVLPPPALSLVESPAPLSTMTWMLDFLSGEDMEDPGNWRLLRSRAESVRDGYSTQSMAVWSMDGKLLLAGRQHVAVFI